MIERADARQAPLFSIHDVSRPGIGEFPPKPPDPPKERPGLFIPTVIYLGWQETGDAGEESIASEGVGAGELAEGLEGYATSEHSEGDPVVFITERYEKFLIKRLMGIPLIGFGTEAGCFELEAVFSGRFEKREDFFTGHAGEIFGAGGLRRPDGPGVGGDVNQIERKGSILLKKLPECDGNGMVRQAAGIAWKISDVGDDVLVARVGRMAMGSPVGRADVDFDVAVEVSGVRSRSDAEGSVYKVGAGFGVPFAGFFDGDGFAGGRSEGVRSKRAVGPNALEMAFGPWIFFLQETGFADFRAVFFYVQYLVTFGEGEGQREEGETVHGISR